MPSPTGSVEVRRGADRPHTHRDGIDSRHSFSFGDHYDPGNVGHGLLVAHHEDRLSPGAGYDAHRHRDTEIVTWVLSGELRHEDADGRREVVGPGTVQRLTAGAGVTHAERHHPGPDPAAPVRFVQSWLVPDEPGLPPSYQRRDVAGALSGGGLVEVASGRPAYDGPGVRLHQRHAALYVGRLRPGGSVPLPAARYLHVFVADGTVQVAGPTEGPLEEVAVLEAGDALRVTDPAARPGPRLTARAAGEVLVWAMDASARDLAG